MSASAPSSNGVDASDMNPTIFVDDVMRNEVEIAHAHHQETQKVPLSRLEKFYVHVSEVYQHELLQKYEQKQQQEKQDKLKQSEANKSTSIPAPLLWPFKPMETKLKMASYQVENIVRLCDELLANARPGSAQNHTPSLALLEKNTEAYERKLKQQLDQTREQSREDRESSLANAPDSEARSLAQAAIDAANTAEEEEAELLADEDGTTEGEVMMTRDPHESILSLETRRKRLGALLIHKRRQFTAATDILQRGQAKLQESIRGERTFLDAVGHLAKYWTIRTIENDVNGSKGPPFNPYQNGLPAGSTSAYPSLMIDYRIGVLDILLDSGKTWLHRNDKGDVFLDEAMHKDDNKAKDESKSSGVKEEGTEMTDDPSSGAASAASASPSWQVVSNRLQRAQNELLYKHLYNALMTEARDWRSMYRRDLHMRNANQTHAPMGGLGPPISNPLSSSPSSASASSAASAAAAASAAYIAPPSVYSSRTWSVDEITPRKIVIQLAGFKEAITIHWNKGVGVPFEIVEGEEQGTADSENPDYHLPLHHARMICNQALSMLLDQTRKNSLANRPLLENVHGGVGIPGADIGFGRDPSIAATTLGASATGQDEPWPTRTPSLIQFITMAVAHLRIVHELRQAITYLQDHAVSKSLPPFRVNVAKTNQPYLYNFTVYVANSFVLDCTVRGMQTEVVSRVPSAQPSALALAAFHSTHQPPNLRSTETAAHATAVNLNITSAQHFADVLQHLLVYYK